MVGDNGDPMPDVWQVESRPSPFDQPLPVNTKNATIATAELDPRGTE